MTAAEVKSSDDSSLQCLSTHQPYNRLAEFDGHTIYMLGDSTMRGQFRELCNNFSRKIIYDINKIRPINADDPEDDHVRMCTNNRGTIRLLFRYQRWFEPGSVGLMQRKFRTFLDSVGSSDSSEPSVIYFNGGLHMLHLFPSYRFRGLWNIYKRVEAHARQFVLNAKSLAPDAILVYMNSHDICEDKYKNEWATAVRDLKTNPMSVVGPCATWLKKEDGVRHKFAIKACSAGTFTSDGVRNINARIESAIASAVKSHSMDKVGCVDAFAITEGRCEDTIDGRHYQKRVPQEINSLAMVLRQHKQIEK